MLDILLNIENCDCFDFSITNCDISTGVNIQNLVMLSLGTNQANWFELQGIDWDKLSKLSLNSTNMNIIKRDFETALSWLRDLNIEYEIKFDIINSYTLHINILINNDKILCYDLRTRRIINDN